MRPRESVEHINTTSKGAIQRQMVIELLLDIRDQNTELLVVIELLLDIRDQNTELLKALLKSSDNSTFIWQGARP